MAQKPIRNPGVHEASEDRVLLVTKHKTTGAERVDWWPSVAEAEASDMKVLEVRQRIHLEKNKTNWTGLQSMLRVALGVSGVQDNYIRDNAFKQKEFFETVDEKMKDQKQ